MTTLTAAPFVAPEIERAAVTILAQARANHENLATWVRQITAEPDYQEVLPIELYVAILAERALPESEGWNEADWRRRCQTDAAVARLARAVVTFRRAGRPTGDVASELWGVGGPLATVTTSLAAAVAEYVQDIANAWATYARGYPTT